MSRDMNGSHWQWWTSFTPSPREALQWVKCRWSFTLHQRYWDYSNIMMTLSMRTAFEGVFTHPVSSRHMRLVLYCRSSQGAQPYLNILDPSQQAKTLQGVRRLFEAADAAGMLLFSKVLCGTYFLLELPARVPRSTLPTRGICAGANTVNKSLSNCVRFGSVLFTLRCESFFCDVCLGAQHTRLQRIRVRGVVLGVPGLRPGRIH
jgi:hypothetical protein